MTHSNITVEVVRAATGLAESISNTLDLIGNTLETNARQRTEDLCRWGDDGGFCPE